MDDSRQDTWLLAVDGSRGAEHAARYVAKTAKAFGAAKIRLVNVRLPPVGAERMDARALRAAALEDAERAAARARRIVELAGLPCALDAPVGDDPAAMIVGAAENLDAAEIVMGTRGVGVLSSITLGSVAYKVVHLARRSVTLVPERTRTGRAARNPLAILIAVDGSPSANRAVQHAAAQAACDSRTRCVLLNVQPRIARNARRFVSKSQVDVYIQGEAAAAMRQGARILERAGVRFETRVATGDAVETILATAAECDCGRIVLGTRGRSAVRSLLLGSVAYGVVHHADVAVTVVKQGLPPPVMLSGTNTRR